MIICEYTTATNTKECALVDLKIIDTTSSLIDMVEAANQEVVNQTAINQNHFALMGMNTPRVRLIELPLVTTAVGRKLLHTAINQHVTHPVMQSDLDAIFRAIDGADE